MDMEFEKLKAIIADVMNVDPNEITKDMTFAADLDADSLDLYQILMNIDGFEDTYQGDDVVAMRKRRCR